MQHNQNQNDNNNNNNSGIENAMQSDDLTTVRLYDLLYSWGFDEPTKTVQKFENNNKLKFIDLTEKSKIEGKTLYLPAAEVIIIRNFSVEYIFNLRDIFKVAKLCSHEEQTPKQIVEMVNDIVKSDSGSFNDLRKCIYEALDEHDKFPLNFWPCLIRSYMLAKSGETQFSAVIQPDIKGYNNDISNDPIRKRIMQIMNPANTSVNIDDHRGYGNRGGNSNSNGGYIDLYGVRFCWGPK